MKNLIKIEPIAVKDKDDVIKALNILENIGIIIYSGEQKRDYLRDKTKLVHNNFMIQDDDGVFRIQSHYLGDGISLESLENQVNNIMENSSLCELLKKIEKNKRKLVKYIKKFEEKYSIIEIKEEYEQNR